MNAAIVGTTARRHPELSEAQVKAVVETVAEELYWELLERSLKWRGSEEVGALWFESEARSCASLVFGAGKGQR